MEDTGKNQLKASHLSNIRVCARMRPLFYDERQAKVEIDDLYKSIEITENKKAMDKRGRTANSLRRPITRSLERPSGPIGAKKRYYLDDIFNEKVSNKQVFNKFCKDLVLRVCDGYNGTIFAYGQTSSGKTHTMIGKKSDPDNVGIDCLAIQQLFDYSLQNEASEISIWISYMEIYNEVINDLLDRDSTNLKIREDTSNSMGAYVEGLTSVKIQSYEEFLKILEKGEKVRHYAKTKLSEKYKDVYSSRSHTIIRLMVQNKPNNANFVKDDEKKIHLSYSVKYSILNLVDLAGSERISDVGSNRTKETSHINTSLFVLSKVINSLAEKSKSSHIPFRDSKLTKLLKNSLGGNSMTSVICTVSPNISHLPLTISTLEFAKRAKNIKIKARANEVIDDHDIVQNRLKKLERLVVTLERTISDLNDELQSKNKENILLKAKLRDSQKSLTPLPSKPLGQKTEFSTISCPVLPVKDYLSREEIVKSCIGCQKDVLNTEKILKKAVEWVSPGDIEVFEKRMDEIEKYVEEKFERCYECQDERKEISMKREEVESRVYTKTITSTKECQTDDSNSEDYVFFQNMIDEYLKQLLSSKKYSTISKDFKLKESQKRELVMDFFNFKGSIRKKIQKFIDKYSAAQAIQEKIQEYTILVKEAEQINPRGRQKDPKISEK